MRPLLFFPALALTLAACRSPPETQAVCGFPFAVDTFTLQSSVLGERRRINVYTPPGYRAAGAPAYPVLYLPDGGLEEDFPHVIDAVKAGMDWGPVRPLIVVGIENTERRRDLTGPTEVAEEQKAAPHAGGSAAFRAFLRQELMPQIRSRYRTSGETAIMGESLAGLFVVETFLEEPELFDAYLAFSPSLQWNRRWQVRHAAERLRAHAELVGKRLYMTSADEEEIVGATTELAKILAAEAPAGLTWSYSPMPEQFHDTIYRASAPRALRVVFAAPSSSAP